MASKKQPKIETQPESETKSETKPEIPDSFLITAWTLHAAKEELKTGTKAYEHAYMGFCAGVKVAAQLAGLNEIKLPELEKQTKVSRRVIDDEVY